jgi:hypothetical protein
MADRTILLAQNKRHATRGLSVVNPQEFLAYQEDDDNLTYIVDMGAYLDGATIVLVTRTPTGVVISNASNTTTRLTQRLAGYGHVDFRVQTSAGDTEQFRVYIQPRAANPAFFLTAGSGGGITALDGDKGDVIVSSAGSTWTLDATAVASLNVFTDTLKGITPASGGGTSNFLRADGTWATPPGGGGGGGGPVSDADYGDITVSGTGTVWTIDNNAVTLAKMADMATASLIYRKTAGTGDPEVQTLATLKTDLGLTGTNSGDQTITLTGNVTGSGTGSFATTIAAGAVGLSQMANMATSSLIYRKTAGSGAPEVNTLATLKTDLGLTGTNSGDQTITLTGDVTGSGTGSFTTAIGAGVIVDGDVNASAAIAYSKLASMTGGSVLLGNASNVPTVTALTGDVTVSNAGVTAIGTGVIVDGDVNASAAIALSKLATQGARTFVANSTSSTAVPTAVSVATAQGMVGQFDTVSAVNSATIDAGINHIRTAGYYATGDGGGALYKRVASGAAGAGTPRITSNSAATIWELDLDTVNVLQFGAYNNDTNAATTLSAFQGAAAFSKSVYIPPGTYLISGTVTVTLNGQRWYGDGFDACIVKSNSTTLPMFTITEFLNNTVIESFRLTRSVTATSGANGIDLQNKVVGQTRFQNLLAEKQWDGFSIGPTDWSEILDCIAQQNLNNGFYIRNKNTAAATSGPCQWNLTNCLSQMNTARGFFFQTQTGPSQMIVGPLKMCATFGNSGVGVGFVGSATVPINDARIFGGFYGSDGNSELYLDTYGDQILIQNCFLERSGLDPTGPTLATPASNLGSGLELTVNNTGAIINNVHSYDNSQDGIASSATKITVTGSRCDNNGRASGAGRRNGVYVVAGRATITGTICGNTSGSPQSFGIRCADGNNVTAIGCDLNGNGTSSFDITSNANSLTVVGCLPNTLNTEIPILQVNAGSATAPTITTDGDLNTGWYFPNADAVTATTGGTRRFGILGGAYAGHAHLGSLNDAPSANDRSSSPVFNMLAINTNGMGICSFGDLTNTLGFVTNNTERMRIDVSGNVVVGAAALATTATNGFLYVPTCAGTPTGTPTTHTGMAPIVVNTTNNKLYFYSGGAWRDAGP